MPQHRRRTRRTPPTSEEDVRVIESPVPEFEPLPAPPAPEPVLAEEVPIQAAPIQGALNSPATAAAAAPNPDASLLFRNAQNSEKSPPAADCASSSGGGAGNPRSAPSPVAPDASFFEAKEKTERARKRRQVLDALKRQMRGRTRPKISLRLSTSTNLALATMTSPMHLRRLLCDYLTTKFAETPLRLLGDISPIEWFKRHYLEGGANFEDSNWKCPIGSVPHRSHQQLASFPQYIQAMRQQGAQGDLLTLSTFQSLFQLRVIVASSHPEDTSEAAYYDTAPPQSLRRSMLVIIDSCPHAHVTVPVDTDYYNLRLSSKMPVILIQSPILTNCYDWAHAESDLWNGSPPVRIERASLTTDTPIGQVFNPNSELSPPDVTSIPVSADLEMRPRPNAFILEVADFIRKREEVRCFLIEEEDMNVSAAENLLSVYERNGLNANVKSLPSLRRMIANIKACRDPLARDADRPSSTPAPTTARGRWAQANCSKREDTARQREANGELPPQHGSLDHEEYKLRMEQLKEAAQALSSVMNVPFAAAGLLLEFHIERLSNENPQLANIVHEAMKAAYAAHIRDHNKLLVDCESYPLAEQDFNRRIHEVAPTPTPHQFDLEARERLDFIQKHLGTGTREMTMVEIAYASKSALSADLMDRPKAVIPPPLERFWMACQYYLENKNLNTPRGPMPHADYQRRIHALAKAELHRQAVTACAASTAAQALAVNSGIYGIDPLNTPHLQSPQSQAAPLQPPPSTCTEPAPAPNASQIQQILSPHVTPCHACNHDHAHPQHALPTICNHDHAHPQHALSTICNHTPQPQQQLQPHALTFSQTQQLLTNTSHHPASTAQHSENPLDTSILSPHIPRASSSAPAAPSPSPYTSHASSAVRMAAHRAEQQLAEKAKGATVVVVSNNQQKPFYWKAGEEKDCKGFFWSTKQAVQQTWEQTNSSEDSHGYRTFRSTIHFSMIPVICAELSLTRTQFDALPEAQLLDLIDQKLAPSGPADYLIKLRQIPFSCDATKALLHRYRAFAEPFIQLTTEAKEAGCPMNEKSIETAFISQIKDNDLMMMWLQEERWTGIQSAHQRIAKHLKAFDALKLLDSLNATHSTVPPPLRVLPTLASSATRFAARTLLVRLCFMLVATALCFCALLAAFCASVCRQNDGFCRCYALCHTSTSARVFGYPQRGLRLELYS
jgi:hypothetical protein